MEQGESMCGGDIWQLWSPGHPHLVVEDPSKHWLAEGTDMVSEKPLIPWLLGTPGLSGPAEVGTGRSGHTDGRHSTAWRRVKHE